MAVDQLRLQPVAPPCRHQGRAVPPPPGTNPHRRYLRCEAGKGDPPGVVSCFACNPACGRYEADPPDGE